MTIGDRIKSLRLAKGLSQEELGNLVGVKKAAIYKYEKGLVVNLKRDIIDKLANALNVSPAYLMGMDDATEFTFDPLSSLPALPVRRIPILGRVAAGLPLYADEQIIGYTVTTLNGGHEYFALRVCGDSMNALGINDGDNVIVRKQDYADDGQVAVVLVDGEDATIKRFYKHGTTVTLVPQSASPAHHPQIYDASKTHIRIIGVVVQSITDIT